MKKIILFMLVGIVLISFVCAENVGDFIQGDVARLYQTCNNCSYCNLTSVNYLTQNKTLVSDISMSNISDTYFYYDLNGENTTQLGDYNYCYDCGNSVEKKTGCVNFEVTPSGNSGSSNIVFFIFAIVLLYTVTFVGFFGRNIPITILGGMALIFLGVYMISKGIIIYRDNLTNYISYLTIAVGFITSSWATLEQFEVI